MDKGEVLCKEVILMGISCCTKSILMVTEEDELHKAFSGTEEKAILGQ